MTVGLRTKAFAAQDALVAALQADGVLPGWTVDYGIPFVSPQDKHVWIDEEVDGWEQKLSGTGGATTREESFRLTAFVYHRMTDATALEIRTTVKAAADAIADVVTGSPHLSATVLFAEVVGGAYEGGFFDPDGRVREGLLRINIGCTAYLV